MADKYVRFLRGTPNAYKRLSVKNQDTLYFISDTNATKGVLYLGDKLITTVDASNVNLAIENLSNVIWDGETPGQILVSTEGGSFEARDLTEVLSEAVNVMTGASAAQDGEQGLVPQPKKGDQVNFLRGDGKWMPVATKAEFNKLQATVSTLVGTDKNANGDVTQSIREIANDEIASQLIPQDARESLNTLKKVGNWIQNHSDATTGINNRLQKIESTLFDSKNPSWPDNRVEGLITVVSNLQQKIDILDPQNVVDMQYDIGVLYDRLKWQNIDGG